MKHYTRTLTIFLFISFAFAQTQLGSDIDGEAADDYSGWSVSMNSAGDRVAIGAGQIPCVYICQIRASDFVQTSKMILLK